MSSITPTGNLQQADVAFKIDSEIKTLKKEINGGFIELAKRLKQVRDDKLYKQLSYETFESYIAQPELGFERRAVYEFIGIYEDIILKLNVSPGTLALIEWTKLREIRPYINEENKEELLSKAKELSRSDLHEEVLQYQKPKENISLPEGKFDVIYIDPPWQYSNSGISGAAENHYPTMSIEELSKLVIPSADNATMFVWVTNPILFEAVPLIEKWGFEYKTNMVWIKDKAGQGFYVKGQHELLLICVKGNNRPDDSLYVRSVVEHPRLEHSQKPEVFYEIIEKLYPNGEYLEMFARSKRDKWTSWGNEV